jgi:hypothetical protein
MHFPPVQMFEQQSALTVQFSDWTSQIAPPHVPPLQLRSQQSVALEQVAPLPRQKLVHCVTPAMPCTGSHRPLQQSFSPIAPGVHAAAGARHVPDGRHTPPWHRPEQQSAPSVHACSTALQSTGMHPPPSQAPEQQSPDAEHAAPFDVHAIDAPQAPAVHVFEQHSIGLVHAAPSPPSVQSPVAALLPHAAITSHDSASRDLVMRLLASKREGRTSPTVAPPRHAIVNARM